jgi:hypothetical protein
MLAQQRPGHQWTPHTRDSAEELSQQSAGGSTSVSRSSMRRTGSSGAPGAAEKQLARLQARRTRALARRWSRLQSHSLVPAQDAFVDAIDRASASASVMVPGDAQSRELRSLSNVRCVPGPWTSGLSTGSWETAPPACGRLSCASLCGPAAPPRQKSTPRGVWGHLVVCRPERGSLPRARSTQQLGYGRAPVSAGQAAHGRAAQQHQQGARQATWWRVAASHALFAPACPGGSAGQHRPRPARPGHRHPDGGPQRAMRAGAWPHAWLGPGSPQVTLA